jgi:hypothetical protein
MKEIISGIFIYSLNKYLFYFLLCHRHINRHTDMDTGDSARNKIDGNGKTISYVELMIYW